MQLNRQARLDLGTKSYWTSYGNVTFEQAAIKHCQEVRKRINVLRNEFFDVQTRCESSPHTIFNVRVEFNDEPSKVVIGR